MKSKILNEIKKIKNVKSVYPFLLSLYLLFKSKEVPITFIEFSAMSGYTSRFLYLRGFSEIFNCSRDFIIKNLHSFTGVRVIIENHVSRGSLPFVLDSDSALFFIDHGEIYSILQGEITKNTFPVKGTAYILGDFKVDRKSFYSVEKFVSFSKLLREEFLRGNYRICNRNVLSGRDAFEKFIEDLKGRSLSDGELEQILYSFKIQTGLSNSIPVFLLGLHHFVKREYQNDLGKAIRSFEDFSMYIREGVRIIGDKPFVSFTDRRRIANALSRAVSSYSRGVQKLQEIELKIS